MYAVKKYLFVSLNLLLHVVVICFLLHQMRLYQMAYQNLSDLISHASIETLERGEK